MSSPQSPRNSSHVRYTASAATTGVPQPYAGMNEKQLLQTIAQDSERTALVMEETLALLRQSLAPSPAPSEEPNISTPASLPDEPTTPKPVASLSDVRDLYHSVRNEVLNGKLKVSPDQAETMNRLDAAFRDDATFKLPEQLQSVNGDQEFEVLANGYAVPRYLIEVLNDFDAIAHGATLYEARPAIVAQILIAQDAKKTTIYPFCMNDDANIPEKGSPCILKKGHRGRHKDNDDGSWA